MGHAIPEKYIPGQIVNGNVTKLTNFGVFVELETELEGLLHISELADHKIEKPQDIVKIGDEVEVKILRVDTDARKIGLSLRGYSGPPKSTPVNRPRKREPKVGAERSLSDSDAQQIQTSRKKRNSRSSRNTDTPPEQGIVGWIDGFR